jgi:hypothetical protein
MKIHISVDLRISFVLKLLNLNDPYVVDIHHVSLQYQNTIPSLVKIQAKKFQTKIIIVNKALMATHGFSFGKNRLSHLATFSIECLFIFMNSIRTIEVHK